MKNTEQNPKLIQSGIIDAIPQTGQCPRGCPDCFYNNGFFRTLDKPLLPTLKETKGKIVRVNSGHDSNIEKKLVLEKTKKYKDKFYNTSLPNFEFPGPVVFTVNGGDKTDTWTWKDVDYKISNVMAVRYRVNTWNLAGCDECIDYFTKLKIPVLLTFMRYTHKDNVKQLYNYEFKKHIINSYYCIKEKAFTLIVHRYATHKNTHLIQACGSYYGNSYCKNCLNCVKNYEGWCKLNNR